MSNLACEPGEYRCATHNDQWVVVYIKPVGAWCSCGKPMDFVRPLTAKEKKEYEADIRRAERSRPPEDEGDDDEAPTD